MLWNVNELHQEIFTFTKRQPHSNDIDKILNLEDIKHIIPHCHFSIMEKSSKYLFKGKVTSSLFEFINCKIKPENPVKLALDFMFALGFATNIRWRVIANKYILLKTTLNF
jgi:hypothetical protein